MNFKAVQQAAGTNVIMSGTILEFKGEGVSPTSGKPWKKVVAQDMDGEKHNVTIRGRLPDVNAVNKPAQFTISTYNGTARDGSPYVGYSGFCDPLPDYSQTTQQVPSPAPPLRQATQPPAPVQNQYPRQPQPETRDYGKENRGKCRVLLYCATLKAGCNPEILNEDVKLLKAIEGLVEKSMNGIGGMPNPDYVGGEEPEPPF